MNNWISVKDMLPDFDTQVLLFDNWQDNSGDIHGDVRVGYLSSYRAFSTPNGKEIDPEWRSEFVFNITHWMPLPEPPKPDNQ